MAGGVDLAPLVQEHLDCLIVAANLVAGSSSPEARDMNDVMESAMWMVASKKIVEVIIKHGGVSKEDAVDRLTAKGIELGILTEPAAV